jgi:hypothetical protein
LVFLLSLYLSTSNIWIVQNSKKGWEFKVANQNIGTISINITTF